MLGTINQADHPLNGCEVELYKVWQNGTHIVRLTKGRKGFAKGDIFHLPPGGFVAYEQQANEKKK